MDWKTEFDNKVWKTGFDKKFEGRIYDENGGHIGLENDIKSFIDQIVKDTAKEVVEICEGVKKYQKHLWTSNEKEVNCLGCGKLVTKGSLCLTSNQEYNQALSDTQSVLREKYKLVE